MRQAASDRPGINVANYVDCFTGRWQIGSGSGSPCGKVLWDPALSVLIHVLSGKTEVTWPVPEVAGPSQLLPVTVCVSRRILTAAACDSPRLQEDLGVAGEGEMGLRGGEALGPGRVAADRWLDNDQKVHLPGKERNAAPWK